jgi:hypothetical protein
MAKKKSVVPPTVAEVVAGSEAIARVVEAVAEVDAVGSAEPWAAVRPLAAELAFAAQMDAIANGVREVAEFTPEDSGADSTQGGADTLPEPTSFAAPEEPVAASAAAPPFSVSVAELGAEVLDFVTLMGQSTGSVEAPGPVVHFADLRSLRATIDTLVYGCHSTREREEAAKSARELLDRLIGE